MKSTRHGNVRGCRAPGNGAPVSLRTRIVAVSVWLRKLVLQRRKIGLGQGEGNLHRLKLGDRDQRRRRRWPSPGFRGAPESAPSCPSIGERICGIAELQSRLLDGGLIGGDGARRARAALAVAMSRSCADAAPIFFSAHGALRDGACARQAGRNRAPAPPAPRAGSPARASDRSGTKARPAFTSWPSVNGAATICPSMRDFTSTVMLARTVPMVFTVTGTLRSSAAATRTGRRAGVGRCRRLPPAVTSRNTTKRDERPAPPARSGSRAANHAWSRAGTRSRYFEYSSSRSIIRPLSGALGITRAPRGGPHYYSLL